MDASNDALGLELSPQRIEVRVVQVAPPHEHRADERGLGPQLRDALDLADRECDILNRQHDGRNEAVGLPREVEDPVVVGAGERRRNVRILHDRKILRENRRQEERHVHAHGIHVRQPSLGVLRAGGDGVRLLGVQRTDVLGLHARLPYRLARNLAPAEARSGLAVDDNDLVAFRGALVVESRSREGPVLRLEVVLPDRKRLEDVAIDVDDRESG